MAAAKTRDRSAARLAAVQALYQMDIVATPLPNILAEFENHWIGQQVEGDQYRKAEAAFFRDIVTGIVREQRAIDPLVDDVLSENWPLKRVEAILRAVLRAGVVINEYVDVAAAFLDQEETGMVNAVLDKLARRTRAAEFQAPEE